MTNCKQNAVMVNDQEQLWGFPGGQGVKNLSCNARDMGSIPGPGNPICH